MYNLGFIDCALASTKIHLGDPLFNANEIVNTLNKLDKNEVSIVAFPELAITGYSLNDLLYQEDLYFDSMDALKYILDNNNYLGIAIIGGLLKYDNLLFNVAYVIQADVILGIIPKDKLTSNESKYFTSGKKIELGDTVDVDIFDFTVPFGKVIFNDNNYLKLGVTIGKNASPKKLYQNGANVIVNINACINSLEERERISIIANAHSIKHKAAYLATSIGASDSSSNVLYSNLKLAYVNGRELINKDEICFEEQIEKTRIDLSEIEYKKRINNISKKIDIPFVDIAFDETEYDGSYGIEKLPFVPKCDLDYKKIIDIQAASMYKRLDYVGCKKVCLGISGGLDSTLALLSLCHMCDVYKLDRKMIIGVRLPTSNNSSKTYNNSKDLMEKLGIDSREINISDSVKENLKLIGHDGVTKDIAYENVQARIRTLTLMNLGNKEGGLVVGTGDMSEIALGWCTFNGDHMAMYGLNCGLPKTAIKATTKYYETIYPEVKDILEDIIDTPISPELAGNNQKTEDIIGKYEINDFILYRYLACGDEKERIEILLNKDFGLSSEDASNYVNNFFKRFFAQQYKRLTGPEGVNVFDLSLCPRGELTLNGDIYFTK